MNVCLSNTRLTGRNAIFIFLWLRPRYSLYLFNTYDHDDGLLVGVG